MRFAQAKGVAAEFVNSSIPASEQWRRLEAAARGEIDELADPGEAAEAFAATFFFRSLMTGQPLDEAFVARHVDRVIASVTG